MEDNSLQTTAPGLQPTPTEAAAPVQTPKVEGEKKKINLVLATLCLLLLIATSTAIFFAYQNIQLKNELGTKQTSSKPVNYEECTKVNGAVIQESYPATCITPQGDRFTQSISSDTSTSPSSASADTANWKTYTRSNGYQIKYPTDWSLTANSSEFSIVKKDYRIVFTFPEAFEPGICIFSDSPDFNKSFPESPIYDSSKCPGNYIEITRGDSIVFRRREMPNTSPEGISNGSWPIYTKNNEGVFVTVPPINYQTPITYDKSILSQMDQILSTFQFTK